MPTTDTLNAQLDRIAAFDSGPYPVVSLYLNMQPDQHGRDNFEPFLRKALADRVRTYSTEGPERKSLEQDAEKIRAHVPDVDKAANGLAIFACSGADFFEAIPLAAPIADHRLYISDQPHLYPLARLLDDFPRYAVLVADTHQARIFVAAENSVRRSEQVESTKTRRHKMGGWSQARYQRHVENYHVHHAKEVVDTLGRIVNEEMIPSIVIAGDEVIVPLLREHMTRELLDKVVDTVKLDIRAPEHEILQTTLELMQAKDAESDRQRVDALLDAYRGSGLAVVGVDDTRTALEMGQVEELVITGTPDMIDVTGSSEASPNGSQTPQGSGASQRSDASLRAQADQAPAAQNTGASHAANARPQTDRTTEEQVADELIVKARQTAARIRIIQDPSLLARVGGVGAFLRFKL